VEHGDGIRFTVDGRPATLPDHRKGATVSARKFVETPEVKIATATAGGGMHLRPNPRPPAARQPAVPEPAAPAAPPPSAQETGGSTMNPMVWMGLVVLLSIIAVILVAARKKRERQ